MRIGAAVLAGGLALLLTGPGGPASATNVRGYRISEAAPTGRVGAVYFDGWACPLTNFHFKGLLTGQFSGRRPLSGWRDDSREAMQAQLAWAHSDGIGFFLFDWYREGVDPCLNVAHDNYLSLQDHSGVGFALLYVNHDPFGVPPDQWPALVDHWVTEDFMNPDYERVNGKPLLVIFDTTLFRQQQGGTDGVNHALALLRDDAKSHGLPGVFVVGGRYTDYLNIGCFPDCSDTDGGPSGLRNEAYDALTEYAYPGVLAPVGGARPYTDVVAAKEQNWEQFDVKSPFPYVPSVMDGWDARPWNETPFWFTRAATEVGGFLRDAVGWVNSHPKMQVEPPPAPPLVLLEAWNELGEGSYVLPTDKDGYAYGRAVAQALGLTWAPPPLHSVIVRKARGGIVRSSPSGISCPRRCATGVEEGRRITLTARARHGFALRRWHGPCNPTSRACSFIVLRDSVASAVFRKLRRRR